MRSGIASVTRPYTSHSSHGQDSPSSNCIRSAVSKPISGGTGRTTGLLSPRGADIQEEGDEDLPPVTRSFRLSSNDSTNAPLAMSSPGEMTPGDELTSPTEMFRWNQTAPHPDYKRISVPSDFPLRAMTFDAKALARIRAEEALKQEIAAKAQANADDFELDQDAARNAQRASSGEDNSGGAVSRKDMISSDESQAPAAVEAHRKSTVVATDRGNTNGANGECGVTTIRADEALRMTDPHDFKVEWIRVGELPFSSIKHLRNPWNQEKEVKVSRDGTELEPGLSLLPWRRLRLLIRKTSYRRCPSCRMGQAKSLTWAKERRPPKRHPYGANPRANSSLGRQEKDTDTHSTEQAKVYTIRTLLGNGKRRPFSFTTSILLKLIVHVIDSSDSY